MIWLTGNRFPGILGQKRHQNLRHSSNPESPSPHLCNGKGSNPTIFQVLTRSYKLSFIVISRYTRVSVSELFRYRDTHTAPSPSPLSDLLSEQILSELLKLLFEFRYRDLPPPLFGNQEPIPFVFAFKHNLSSNYISTGLVFRNFSTNL